MCRRFHTTPACDGRTDGHTDRQTDGIAVASTALAMRALACNASIAAQVQVADERRSRPPSGRQHRVYFGADEAQWASDG